MLIHCCIRYPGKLFIIVGYLCKTNDALLYVSFFKTENLEPICRVHEVHRIRINTEEKATVVAAVWGTELIKLLAALAILRQDYFEEQDTFILFCKPSYSSNRLVQNNQLSEELYKIEYIFSSKQQRRPSLLYLSFFCDEVLPAVGKYSMLNIQQHSHFGPAMLSFAPQVLTFLKSTKVLRGPPRSHEKMRNDDICRFLLKAIYSLAKQT